MCLYINLYLQPGLRDQIGNIKLLIKKYLKGKVI